MSGLSLKGLNHITLAVSDLELSLSFYANLLGFKGHVRWDGGAYLSLGDLWLCLSCDKPCVKADYTHFAFSVAQHEFYESVHRLKQANVVVWKENKSEGDSFYFLDPDQHKLELHAGDLVSRLQSLRRAPYKGMTWLSDE